MLLPADAALARRDTALPGLGTLLDAERFAGRVRQVSDARVENAQLLGVRYKAGTSCLALLRVELHGRVVDVHAKALRSTDRHVIDKTRAAAGDRTGFFGTRFALEPELIEVAIFPADRRLPSLEDFGDEERRRDILARVGADERLQCGELSRVAYRPEVRWTGKLVGADGRAALVHVHAQTSFEAAQTALSKLPRVDGLVLPGLVGQSRRHGVLALDWLDGVPMTVTSPGSAADRAALHALGAALAELHTQRGSQLSLRPPDVEAALVLNAARDIAALCPPLGARAFAIARELGQRLAEAPLKQRVVHGDLQPRHIVLTADGRIGLIDCERAACGDPAIDLGSLIAHWERDAAAGTLQYELLEMRREQLLDGYRGHALPTAARIGLYTAAALFRIAPDLFARRAPNWSDDMARALFRCEALLRRMDSTSVPMLTVDHALSA